MFQKTCVAQKKGGCIRKARGKTIDSAFSPQYYGPNFPKKRVQKYMKFMLHEYWAKKTKKFNSISR